MKNAPTASASRLPDAARRFLQWVLGFGVAVGIGLAPFLGERKIPAFEALLEVLPQELRGILIPASALMMGIIAVGVQFYSGEFITRRSLRRRFLVTMISVLIGLLALILVRGSFVIPVTIDPEQGWQELVVIGWSRLDTCGCPKNISDEKCIERIGIDDVSSCWSTTGVKNSLRLGYLCVMGSFGALVGLLILQTEMRRRERQGKTGQGAPGRPQKPGRREGPQPPGRKSPRRPRPRPAPNPADRAGGNGEPPAAR
jgi:hypothetical protein